MSKKSQVEFTHIILLLSSASFIIVAVMGQKFILAPALEKWKKPTLFAAEVGAIYETLYSTVGDVIVYWLPVQCYWSGRSSEIGENPAMDYNFVCGKGIYFNTSHVVPKMYGRFAGSWLEFFCPKDQQCLPFQTKSEWLEVNYFFAGDPSDKFAIPGQELKFELLDERFEKCMSQKEREEACGDNEECKTNAKGSNICFLTMGKTYYGEETGSPEGPTGCGGTVFHDSNECTPGQGYSGLEQFLYDYSKFTEEDGQKWFEFYWPNHYMVIVNNKVCTGTCEPDLDCGCDCDCNCDCVHKCYCSAFGIPCSCDSDCSYSCPKDFPFRISYFDDGVCKSRVTCGFGCSFENCEWLGKNCDEDDCDDDCECGCNFDCFCDCDCDCYDTACECECEGDDEVDSPCDCSCDSYYNYEDVDQCERDGSLYDVGKAQYCFDVNKNMIHDLGELVDLPSIQTGGQKLVIFSGEKVTISKSEGVIQVRKA